MILPILYSFRRCPYAIRARLALSISGIAVEIREVLLRDKAIEFLNTSPSATVPCLKVDDLVLDESLDIMVWALKQNDPDDWLVMPELAVGLIEQCDGAFKQALDRTKYQNRYPNSDPEEQRQVATLFLNRLEQQLLDQQWLFGSAPSMADMAILPFVRQFAFINKSRFDEEAGPAVRQWLDHFLSSPLFLMVMPKLPVWQAGAPTTIFQAR